MARRSLERYRRRGLDALERGMVATVDSDELAGARVLEIGGGIGAIQTELLAAGADSGEVVELVAAYRPYARELAQEKGLAERTTFRVENALYRGGVERIRPQSVDRLSRKRHQAPRTNQPGGMFY